MPTGHVRLFVLAVLCASLQIGCSREPAPSSKPQVVQTSPSSKPAQPPKMDRAREMARKLRAVHERADEAVGDGQRASAGRALADLFSDLRSDSPHTIAVRQDLAARAAELLLDEDARESKRLAEAGLALSSTPTVLRANLLIALADAEKALGNPGAARSALVDALSINQRLFESELENP